MLQVLSVFMQVHDKENIENTAVMRACALSTDY